MFTSLETYEQFIYELPRQYPALTASTLVLVRRGHYIAQVRGTLHFPEQKQLRIYEELIALPTLTITGYSYEAWQGNTKLYWYDPQPHPNIPELAPNHPHHNHIPPDIKHNRVTALNLSFTQANLPFLIQELLETIQQ